MKISGFSFVHNAIDSGYPIIEAIEVVKSWVDDVYIVDMQSTDTTRQVLEKLNVNIIDGKWGNMAGETLAEAHKLHVMCSGDVIIHFEADEIYPSRLLQEIIYRIDVGQYDLSVLRLQLEQNFQRCRWYPEDVHRVFRRGTVIKDGHTTGIAMTKDIPIIDSQYGFLWDITNCFRDNWRSRIDKQAKLRQELPNYLRVPLHVLGQRLMSKNQVTFFLSQQHWLWKNSPFDLPDSLKQLVGITKYSEGKSYKRLMG